jgi:hypothetical protein
LQFTIKKEEHMNTGTANVVGGGVSSTVVNAGTAKAKRPLSEKQAARVELNRLVKELKAAGNKSGDICRALLHKGFTESEVGYALGIDAKTVHASKIDFSVAGRAKAEKTGKRVHLDLSKSHIVPVNGDGVNKLVQLVKVLNAA